MSTYGLKIINANGVVIVDTDEVANNTFIDDRTTLANTNMGYPGISSTIATDLILAAPSVSGTPKVMTQDVQTISRYEQQTPSSTGGVYFGSNTMASHYSSNAAPNGIRVARLRIAAGVVPAAGAQDWGLDVYNADNSIKWSATRSRQVDIIAHGSIAGSAQTILPPYLFSGLDFSRVYAVVNHTTHKLTPGSAFTPDLFYASGYIFRKNGSNPYIVVRSYFAADGVVGSQSEYFGSPTSFAYMIVYDRGEV